MKRERGMQRENEESKDRMKRAKRERRDNEENEEKTDLKTSFPQKYETLKVGQGN